MGKGETEMQNRIHKSVVPARTAHTPKTPAPGPIWQPSLSVMGAAPGRALSITPPSTVQAKAITPGKDVAFGAGQHAPQSAEGQKLLAHEVAHLGQQGQAATGQPPQQNAGEYRNCSRLQTCKAITRKNLAHAVVGKAIQALSSVQPGKTPAAITSLLSQHFNQATSEEIQEIRGRYESIRAILGAPIQFVCEESREQCTLPDGRPGGGFATGNEIHLCPYYFGIYTCPTQVRTMIHEAAHLSPGFNVDIYADGGDGAYKDLKAPVAKGNPDSYAMFALGVSPGVSCDPCAQK